jgi:uncharacterized protein
MATFNSAHDPGTFCWLELGTSDAGAAKKFYTDVFGWTVNETDMGEGMGMYYIFQKGGRDAAAMYQIGPQQQGMPPNWMSYVAVTSADDVAAKAKSLGGNVIMDPFDVWDFGRMTVLVDPQGAHVAVWQAKQHIGLGARDESDTLCWNELQARDVDAAKKFYPALFGWTMKESLEYTEWQSGGKSVGGMMQSQAPPQVPAHWLPYFAVDDCDATVAKATAGGAQTIVPPMDYPNVGRFSVLSDPQGAVFAVIKLAMRA